MWLNPQLPADLVTFSEEIFHGKLHFLCSVNDGGPYDLQSKWMNWFLYDRDLRHERVKRRKKASPSPIKQGFTYLINLHLLTIATRLHNKASSRIFDRIKNTHLLVLLTQDIMHAQQCLCATARTKSFNSLGVLKVASRKQKVWKRSSF